MDACPPLEDIAAFLDDTLSPEERERIAEHLARCESCYEVFAGAAHFELEEGSSADDIGRRGVIQFPLVEEKPQEKHVRAEQARTTRRVSRWLPLAASVVLAVGLGYMIWQRSQVLPEVTVAGVVEPLQGKTGLRDAPYQPEVERGDPRETPLTPPEPSEFLAGVYLVDLQLRLSVPAGKVRPAEEILSDLAGALEQTMIVSPEIVTFFKNQSLQADLEVLARELPKQESALENELAEAPLFRFGIWTEAARVSAKVRSPAFFEQRRNRRVLALIQREIPADERYQPILGSLQKIEPLWESSPRNYEALALHFENIIDQFERIQKEDQDPEYLPDS